MGGGDTAWATKRFALHTDELLRAPPHTKHTWLGQVQTGTPGRQSLNHKAACSVTPTDSMRINQSCTSHTLSLVGKYVLYIQTFFHELMFNHFLPPHPLLISPVVKTTAVAVLRKSVITATKPFTGNQNEVPDGKAHCSGMTVIIPVYILIIRLFALAIFSR